MPLQAKLLPQELSGVGQPEVLGPWKREQVYGVPEPVAHALPTNVGAVAGLLRPDKVPGQARVPHTASRLRGNQHWTSFVRSAVKMLFRHTADVRTNPRFGQNCLAL